VPQKLSDSPAPARAPRFSWPVRILLFLVLFHMFFRSTDILYPWEEWLPELKLKRMPKGLPTRAELAKMTEDADGSSEPALKAFKECGAALVRYWNPTPTDETAAELTSEIDWLKYGLAWTASRLQWCECILGADQEWPMFSPNVGKLRWATRARLRFEDGSEITIRQRSEPEDLTSYSRWSQGKNLGYDRFVFSDHGRRWDACPGYCNLLSHRYSSNAKGSPLRAIILYEVKLNFVPPGEDAREFLRDQMEKTCDYGSMQARWAFFVYFPGDRTWRFISREKDPDNQGAPARYYLFLSEEDRWRFNGWVDPYPLPAYPEKLESFR
jgi:hypothetical protein